MKLGQRTFYSMAKYMRCQAIWTKEILGFQVDEVAAALWMSPRTIECYVSKVLNSGDVKAGIIGRPANGVAMPPHVEALPHRIDTQKNVTSILVVIVLGICV